MFCPSGRRSSYFGRLLAAYSGLVVGWLVSWLVVGRWLVGSCLRSSLRHAAVARFSKLAQRSDFLLTCKWLVTGGRSLGGDASETAPAARSERLGRSATRPVTGTQACPHTHAPPATDRLPNVVRRKRPAADCRDTRYRRWRAGIRRIHPSPAAWRSTGD